MIDICIVSELLFTIMYADDTGAFDSGKDLAKLITVINAEYFMTICMASV